MIKPPFKDATIAIVGVGLIGGSLGLAFKRLGIGQKIIGISRPETLDEACALGVVDDGYAYEVMEDGISQADLVFLCAPISRIIEQLPAVMRAATSH